MEIFEGAGIQCPVPLSNPLREAGANAAHDLWRGSPSARAGFNGGVAWTLERIKRHHPDAWEKIAETWA